MRLTLAAIVTAPPPPPPPPPSWIERWTHHEETYEVSLSAAAAHVDGLLDGGTTTTTPPNIEEKQRRRPWKTNDAVADSSSTTCKSSTLTYVLHGLTTGPTPIVEKEAKTQPHSPTTTTTTTTSIEEWSNFCASVFAYKKPNPPPPSYFFRHYVNDPDRVSPSLIRVATTTSKLQKGRSSNSNDDGDDDGRHHPPQEIVASVRIFLRRLSIGNKLPSSSSSPSAPSSSFIWAGGIGEVCTSENHRRRGLSRRLLETAIEMMKELPLLDVSLLHAGPTFQPVYEKFGYVSTRTNWSKLRIKCTVLKQKYCDLVLQMTNHHERSVAVDDDDDDDISRQTPVTTYSVRQASFPEDTTRLMELHQRYSEQRLRGCIVRTEEYWNDYMSVELDKSLFVLVQEDFVRNVVNGDNNIQQDQDDDDHDKNGVSSSSSSSSPSSSKRIIAWLSIRPRGDYYQLREFGMDIDDDNNDDDTDPDPDPDPRFSTSNNNNLQTSLRNKIKTFDALCILLAHVLDFSHDEEEETSTATDRNRTDCRNTDDAISVLVPQFVMDEIKSQAAAATDGGGGDDDDVTNRDIDPASASATNTDTSTDKADDEADDDYDNTDDNTVIDRGWMYLNLSNSPAATEYLQSIVQDPSSMATNHSNHQHQHQHHSHMIWPSDSF